MDVDEELEVVDIVGCGGKVVVKGDGAAVVGVDGVANCSSNADILCCNKYISEHADANPVEHDLKNVDTSSVQSSEAFVD